MMQSKRNARVNTRHNQELSSGINLIKFWIIICLPLIEMLITAVLICKFCNTCKEINDYKWYLIGLIPCSIISSVLIVTIRGIRSRLAINYIILLLNIAAYVMGECGILSVIPVLVFIGQQVKSGSSKRMFDSDYILDATMISIIYLYIFYSIAVQFLQPQEHHNFVTC
uniref:Uncharacterized protein n=1 Tax=Schistosoma japonicum TaxID=6182 RepID=C1L3P3_SCHJA|nr:hypothetical protein [Schistosoma japonicum]